MTLEIPITHSARRYGFVFWLAEMDHQMERWIGNNTVVPVVFDGKNVGHKTVDWSRRRIYVGIPRTSAMRADCAEFRITFRDGIGLIVRTV